MSSSPVSPPVAVAAAAPAPAPGAGREIVYHFRTQGVGAEGVHIAGMVRGFARWGWQTRFVSPAGRDPLETAGRNPFGDGKGRAGLLPRLARRCPPALFEMLELGYNLHASRALEKSLRAGPCHLLYERHAFFLMAGARLAARHRLPLVVEVNELVGDERIRAQPLLSPLARAADRYTFRRASLIVVVSPHLKRRIVAQDIAPEKIVVLPNAIDPAAFARPADGGPWRARWGLGPEHRVVGFTGWFVPWHRLDFLLEVFAAVARHDALARLVLIGEGALRPALEAQIATLGLAGRVLLPGAVPHVEVPAAMAALDVAIVPHSNAYRSPIKLFEYMAQGRTTVAPATEPIATVCRDGANSRLFAPLDAPALTTVLRELLADAGQRTRLGAQARADILAHHKWEDNAERVLHELGLPAWRAGG